MQLGIKSVDQFIGVRAARFENDDRVALSQGKCGNLVFHSVGILRLFIPFGGYHTIAVLIG